MLGFGFFSMSQEKNIPQRFRNKSWNSIDNHGLQKSISKVKKVNRISQGACVEREDQRIEFWWIINILKWAKACDAVNIFVSFSATSNHA